MLGETHDALVVGVPDDERALAVGEQLFEHDDFADLLEAHDPHDVHGLVEHDLTATVELRHDPHQGSPRRGAFAHR